MLKKITVLILTYNEAPNIGRTLERLSWARDIVVVDSFSSDETVSITSKFPNVSVVQRKFVSHADQWNFALTETGIATEWVLALDADYLLSPELIEELRQLVPAPGIGGYQARFTYCVEGKSLHGTLYPPVTVLFRREGARYLQDGHTQRISINGSVGNLKARIFHDDRKPLSSWVQAQVRYMRLEAEKLSAPGSGRLGWADRLRKLRVVAPFVMFFYCLFGKRAILDGRPGMYYALQRTFAELLLSLCLLENDLGRKRNV